MIAKALVLAGSLALASCASTGANSMTDVQKLLQDLATAESNENLEATTALYAPDAQWLPPGSPPLIGLPAIRETLRGIFEANDCEIEISVHEIRAAGDFAYAVGASRATVRPRKGGSPATTNDTYVLILQRVPPDARWKIRYLMWNSTAP